MWKNPKILKRTYNPPEPDLLSSERKLLKTVNEKATAFLEHFSKASSTANLPAAQQTFQKKEEDKMDLTPPTGQDEPITLFELTRALRKIRNTKTSPGPDNISYSL